MAKIKWINTSGGDWADGANWSGGNVPGQNDSVVISVANGQATAYTVDLDEDAGVKSLTLDQPVATLFVEYGTLSTHLKLQAGTLGLYYGTFTGLVADTGGVLDLTGPSQIGSGQGTLENVTWQGDLAPIINTADAYSGTLSVVGGLTLTGTSGKGPGTLILDQPSLTVSFVGAQTLDNATVYLGAGMNFGQATLASSADEYGVADLTLGAHLAIDVAGDAAMLDDGDINNEGTISTAGSTYLPIFSYGAESTFTNSGTFAINAAADVSPGVSIFDNTGSLTVASGGTLDLSSQNYYITTNFENTGVVIDDGIIEVGGTITTSVVQGWNVTYGATGTLALSSNGTLVNTGANLVLGDGGIVPQFALSGTIVGGTVTENGSGLIAAGGTLSGIVLDGTLSIDGYYQSLSIADGIQLVPGTTISVTGNDSSLNFDSSQTLSQATLVLGSSEGAFLATNDSTLTLAATTLVEVNGGTAGLTGSGTIINEGNIDVSGGLLELSAYDTSIANDGTVAVSGGGSLFVTSGFSNNGVITLQDSTLLVGDVEANLLTSITLSDSNVDIVGQLDATGTTVDVGDGTHLGDVVVGVSSPVDVGSVAGLLGGTIRDAGGGLIIEGSVSLTGVTYQGELSIAAAYARVVVSGLTLENSNGTGMGTLTLSGAQSTLVVASGTVLDNGTIDIGSSIVHQGNTTLAAPTIEAQATGGPPTLGGHLIIDQTAKYAGIGVPALDGATVSDATIDAAFKGGRMLLDGTTFVSAGTITIGATEVVTSAAGSFTNQGLVSIAAGGTLSLNLLNYYQLLPDSLASFENTGTMTLAGGMISEQSGNGVPPVPLRNDAAGTIGGAGVVAVGVANYGTITAAGGELTLSQAVSGGGGTLEIGGSATLSLLGAVSAGETAVFGGPDGVLGLAAKSFLGEIGGFASGDTIDLLKLKASSAEFIGSSISVTLANGGTIALITTQPLSGALSVTSDGHGGSLIGFAEAAHEAALVPLTPPASTGWVQMEARFEVWDEVMHHFGI